MGGAKEGCFGYLNFVHDLEPLVVLDVAFENLCEATVLTDVVAKSFDAVGPDDEP